jgi:hypothetical protein
MLSSMVTPSHVATMGLLLVSGIWATVLFKVGTARTATRDATLTTFLLWVLGLTPVLVQLVSPRAFLTRFDITTQDTGVVALGVRVSQIGTLVAMGISAVILLSPGKSNTSRRPALALVAFYLTAFFSAVLGSHGGVGRPILLAPLAMLALAFGQRPSPDSLLHHLRWITRVYTWGSLVALVVAHSWATFRVALYQDTYAERNYFGVGQLVGLTPHPNVLGPIAATALLLELTRRARRPGWWINAGAAAGVLLLAQSRTSWLAAAVAIVAMALAPTPGRRRGRTSAALTSALVASIASILAVPTVQTFVANLTGNRDLTTGNGRTLAFHYAYALRLRTFHLQSRIQGALSWHRPWLAWPGAQPGRAVPRRRRTSGAICPPYGFPFLHAGRLGFAKDLRRASSGSGNATSGPRDGGGVPPQPGLRCAVLHPGRCRDGGDGAHGRQSCVCCVRPGARARFSGAEPAAQNLASESGGYGGVPMTPTLHHTTTPRRQRATWAAARTATAIQSSRIPRTLR